MAANYIELKCSPDDVFRVLDDGWLYASWVVGASRIRDIDDRWPDPGTSIRHSFGLWPVLIDDVSYSVEWDRPHHALLRARGWPIGEALIAIDVKPRGDGCIVRMYEDAVKGPGLLVPKLVRDIIIHFRNGEAIKRLGHLAEGYAGRHPG
ncbi:SRPBCC family protein [Marisediminicola sp. LYQ134]|uniref:SRPBCC family protein n=1 Tax=unclassified Marisediminicola TaxID=2618316 RepID=UPI0039830523